MAATVSLSKVILVNNPSKFSDPIRLQITFDSVAEQLEEELEFKVIFVTDPKDESKDLQLKSVFVGSVRK